MGVIRPRPPASQNLASDRAANLADRQQIRRLLSQQRAARPAEAGALGGFTRAESGSHYVKPSGTELYFEDYTLDGGWNAGPGMAPTLVAPAGSFMGVQDDGWYAVRGYFYATVGTVDRVRLKWCTNGDHQGGAIESYQTVMKYGSAFESSMWVGPIWLPAATTDSTYPIGVIAEWSGASFPTIGTSGVTFDVWRIG